MTPEFITFTGIDARTNLARAESLSCRYPIEWGVLFSKSNRDSRYPCDQAVKEIVAMDAPLVADHPFMSAHLCGRYAREAISGDILGSLNDIPLSRFDRIQVNGYFVGKHHHLQELERATEAAIILQTRTEFDEGSPFQQLFDCSGGNGVLPERIPSHLGRQRLVGYAGGISADTLFQYLAMMQEGGRFWIDMESGVRTNGWFDLDKVERICALVYGPYK